MPISDEMREKVRLFGNRIFCNDSGDAIESAQEDLLAAIEKLEAERDELKCLKDLALQKVMEWNPDAALGRLVRRMPELERTNVDEIKLTWTRIGNNWKVRDGEDKIIARADTPTEALKEALNA